MHGVDPIVLWLILLAPPALALVCLVLLIIGLRRIWKWRQAYKREQAGSRASNWRD